MKVKVLVGVLIISLIANVYTIGKYLLVDQWYEPSKEESIILSEMVQKTVESADYQALAQKQNIISIDSYIDKNKGGVYPFYFEVSVSTDQQTYYFGCKDDSCAEMVQDGTSASLYDTDEQPRLPLKK